jgi:hypothetical protein
MEAEGAKLLNILDYQKVSVLSLSYRQYFVSAPVCGLYNQSEQNSICVSASSADSGSSGLSSVLHGIFIAEQVDGGGDKRQDIPQWLMYKHSWKSF